MALLFLMTIKPPRRLNHPGDPTAATCRDAYNIPSPLQPGAGKTRPPHDSHVVSFNRPAASTMRSRLLQHSAPVALHVMTPHPRCWPSTFSRPSHLVGARSSNDPRPS